MTRSPILHEDIKGPGEPVPVPPRPAASADAWVDEGFASFVRNRSGALARTAYLLTADRQLAEDLLQTSLAKVADRWSRIAQSGDPTAYVRKVMLNTAISWRRRRSSREVPTAMIPERWTDSDSGSLAEERLRIALSAIPPRQRAVLVLRYYDDLSEADTAAMLGCSVGTVKSQAAKGLARLRSQLAEPSTTNDQSNGA